jgi:hypothetical protein
MAGLVPAIHAFATEWSLKNPEELPAVVLDRAATLFGEINKRF